jgi:predicted RNA binding protein YcfA (HicA-like mRNA interferase family)
MKTKELIRLLEQTGYVITNREGSHIILRHLDYDSILVVPDSGNKELPPAVLRAVVRNVTEKGILSREAFSV